MFIQLIRVVDRAETKKSVVSVAGLMARRTATCSNVYERGVIRKRWLVVRDGRTIRRRKRLRRGHFNRTRTGIVQWAAQSANKKTSFVRSIKFSNPCLYVRVCCTKTACADVTRRKLLIITADNQFVYCTHVQIKASRISSFKHALWEGLIKRYESNKTSARVQRSCLVQETSSSSAPPVIGNTAVRNFTPPPVVSVKSQSGLRAIFKHLFRTLRGFTGI